MLSMDLIITPEPYPHGESTLSCGLDMKFGLSEGKSASTPIDAEKPLLKDLDGEDVDVHTYRKKIVISKDVIWEILQLDDAEGVVCLSNEDIFAGLAQMGYEKPSTKLTFYKAFFSILDTCSALTRRVKNLEHDKAAQKLEIIKLMARVKRLERANKDKGKGILIETPKPMKKKDQIELDAEYARKLHEEVNKDHEEINMDIDWDAAIDHVKQKSKNPQYIKSYQVMKKRPQTESEARKNMMIYLKNTAGYKLDFFKGMSYPLSKFTLEQLVNVTRLQVEEECKMSLELLRFDANMRFLFKLREEIEEEDQEVLKSINETLAQQLREGN
nr:hypothetical protein [Tanacetum cinerariifolium]